VTLLRVRTAAEETGLAFRGAFHPAPADIPAGLSAGTIVMLGFIGGGHWPSVTASEEFSDGRPHPLDRWSFRVISTLAKKLDAIPLFPFTAPPMPFIRWAQKAEAVQPSEIGMLIHPDYGLWHAWRGALAFRDRLDLPEQDRRPRPCDSCAAKPCLTACPVGAFRGNSAYNVAACGAHIRTPEGVDCMTGSCRARRACPVGADYRYSPAQSAFHMRSFRGG